MIPFLVIVALCMFWSLIAAGLPPVLLPSPWEVAVACAEHRGLLGEATLQTALGALVGLLISCLLGVSTAVAFRRLPPLELALMPVAVMLQTLPIVAIAPLLVVWLGYGTPVAVCSAAICSVFPVLVGMNTGMRAAPTEEVDLVRLYTQSWWQVTRVVRIPRALPYLLAGIRTASGLAVIGAIVGEFVGSNGTPAALGYIVLRSARSADTALTIAAVFCAGGLATMLVGVGRWVETKWVAPWGGRDSVV